MKNTTNQTNTTKYYSQCGEDKFLAKYLKSKKIAKTIVEIGAGMPEEFSNSLYFINKGWKACLVEPNHTCYTELVKYHKDNAKVKIYQVLIGDTESITELDISHQHWALGKEATAKSKIKQVVGKNTLENILNDFGEKEIGILSIDIEGGEAKILEVLKGGHLPMPKIILVESLDEQATKDIEQALYDMYELVEVLSLTRVYKLI